MATQPGASSRQRPKETAMKRTLLATALFLTSGLAAADNWAIREEAEINGLTEREQRMISGAPSTYANYRTSYWQVRDKLRRQALADERYYEERVARPRRSEVVVSEPAVLTEPEDTAETYAL